MNIPDDVWEVAQSVATRKLFSPDAETEANELACHIARALISEREAAVKAERERCAGIAENGSFPFDISVWLESTKKEMTALTAEATAAAIRKGGE